MAPTLVIETPATTELLGSTVEGSTLGARATSLGVVAALVPCRERRRAVVGDTTPPGIVGSETAGEGPDDPAAVAPSGASESVPVAEIIVVTEAVRGGAASDGSPGGRVNMSATSTIATDRAAPRPINLPVLG